MNSFAQNPRHPARRLLRYARGWALLPRTLQANARMLEQLVANHGEGQGAPQKSYFELADYPGYGEADLAVFAQFSPAAAPSPGFVTDWIGSRTRIASLWDGVEHMDNTVLGMPVPCDYHAEAIEWIGALNAVLHAKERFVAMEVGAGHGPWITAAGVAARLRGIDDIRLTGIEADPGRFTLMRQHLADNGFDPEGHNLVQAAVGVADGSARWPKIAEPRNNAGGRVAEDAGPDDGMIDVRIVSFASLLAAEPLWDMIHIDIQGDEFPICEANLATLQQKARYLIIGTHSRKIDGQLVDLFHNGGFLLENEKPTRFAYTPTKKLEDMTTHDGAQVWRNPRV